MSEDFEAKKIEIATNTAMINLVICQTLHRPPMEITVPSSDNISELVESMIAADSALPTFAELGWITVAAAELLSQAILHWVSASYIGRAFAAWAEPAAYTAAMFALEAAGAATQLAALELGEETD